MSTDRPDDTDDLPTLRPLPADDREALARDYREPPAGPRRRPGFGFWVALLWSLLYFFATQMVLGVLFLVLFIGIALIPEFREHGMDALEPDRLKAWTEGPAAHVASLCAVGATQFGGLALSWLLLRLVIGRTWKRKI